MYDCRHSPARRLARSGATWHVDHELAGWASKTRAVPFVWQPRDSSTGDLVSQGHGVGAVTRLSEFRDTPVKTPCVANVCGPCFDR